jgi:4-hydroxyphenylpyruvate dioxygenase
MQIDHVHFYVENARSSRNWFVRQLGFQAVAAKVSSHTCTEVVKSGPSTLSYLRHSQNEAQ